MTPISSSQSISTLKDVNCSFQQYMPSVKTEGPVTSAADCTSDSTGSKPINVPITSCVASTHTFLCGELAPSGSFEMTFHSKGLPQTSCFSTLTNRFTFLLPLGDRRNCKTHHHYRVRELENLHLRDLAQNRRKIWLLRDCLL